MNYDQEFKVGQRAYLETFREALDELERQILALADPLRRGNSQRSLMRELHSIKGTAGSYELTAIKSLVHRLEDQVASSSLEDKDAVVLIENLLKGKDHLEKLGNAYAQDDVKALAVLKQQIGFLSTDEQVGRPAATAASVPNEFRVLLAEPTATIANRCKAAFKGTGAEVTWCKDGYEALGIALTERFDAIIISAQIPTVDGINFRKVLSLMKSPNRLAKFCVLTSDAARLKDLVDPDTVLFEKNQSLTTVVKDTFAKALKAAGLEAVEVKDEEKKGAAKVLLVDDSLDIHKLLGLSFKKFPEVKIEGLTNPLEALKLSADAAFDVAILDVQMPEMDGQDLLVKLKELPQWKNKPIFFLTGTEDPAEIEKLRKLGAAGVFKKPFSPKAFAEQFLQALGALPRKVA